MSKKIQTQEMILDRSIFMFAFSIPIVAICYLFFVYSSTASAYAIEQQDKNAFTIANEISEIETEIHNHKRTITLRGSDAAKNLVGLGEAKYLDTDTNYYSLARGISSSN